ncbi:hypothetical protein ALI22I_33435 [Saccharothrix sp. ALI-22-I]|uniref:protein DpdJ n=1 Tax=Saccharothrix sp. ALI-22-I TaxID=1933778 RepID=UPI0009D16D0F|nr:protein DpdJ [Saccharothrix sp. ALI-22-I]ONI83419.1 hypothetical protein ALI22I_33435 [Saccharothrix sp. ALI-22-I]
MDDVTLEALTAVELSEARLLSWGAVGAEWEEQELLAILGEHGPAEKLLAELLDAALIVRTPNNGYRSRSAETVRLIANVRQSFRGQRVSEGKPLVLDHRFLHRPRRRPERNVPVQHMLTELGGLIGPAALSAVHHLAPPKLSGFQCRSTQAVLEALRSDQPAGVMVTAGTGSGKTLAFYLPLLAWLADRTASGHRGGTLGLALYPRNELLKDQLKTLLGYVMSLHASAPDAPVLSLATWFGPTPHSAYAVGKGWSENWERRAAGVACPYLRCLVCDNELIWPNSDLTRGVERLVCVDRSCGAEVDGKFLRLTRESARRRPADLMLSTTESLNRQLSAPGNLVAFGVRPSTLAAVLLDEVHTYEGTTGAQNALLLRRLKHMLNRVPVWVGLSATLSNAGEFFARLVDLPPSAVGVVHPRLEELEEAGAEYLLAVRSDPHSKAGPLSTSIQTTMVLARSLDSLADDPFNPPSSSGGVFGSRLFVFTDKLDSTNRLYWSLLDTEGWLWPGKAADRTPLTLAHLRAEEQERLKGDHQEKAADRDADGQWWWMPELLGHGVEADRQLRLGRTSSQDRGVSGDAQVIVATATLEVGFDDDRVGAVVQHKAPHDAAQFLQRKGRAGRNQATRPWTVVVLSDWGRDRQAWEGYDALFDPDLPPRNLPIENLYVLRIQAVYALMDWLAAELRYDGQESTWADLSGPASALFPNGPERQAATARRQEAMADLLSRLLRSGPERQRLRRHLLLALGLGSGEIAESVVDSLLWDAPRPLLLAVVPTIRRRLVDQWRGEEPRPDDTGLRTRTPLRSFVPGNLFDDLLVPDVELVVPGKQGKRDVEHLPALRALREFTPGNVTRHFGVWATHKRHWLPLPAGTDDAQLRVDMSKTYAVVSPVDLLDLAGTRVEVYSPVSVELQPVPAPVRDYSAVQPDWEFHVSRLGSGTPIRVDSGARELLTSLTAHVHAQGGGVRTIRYARTAVGTIWQPQARVVRLHYGVGDGDAWRPAAIGVDVHCDALEGEVRFPETIHRPDPTERTSRLRHNILVEADLPDELSSFDRESLTEIALLAIVSSRLKGEDPADDQQWADALVDAARTLGLTPDDDDHQPSDHGMKWVTWCNDHDVISAVATAATEVLEEDRSPAWTTWWRRRYTLSVAHLVVSALSSLVRGVDVEELTIDLAPDGDTRFWVSEPSPGGTGQVETFLRLLVHEPEAFSRALEDALEPTSVDTLDEELVSLLTSESEEVRASLVGLREAWTAGHTAVGAAVQQVDAAAHEQGLTLGGPARSSLSTRLAGPGAHPRLLEDVISWLDLRNTAVELAGLDVGPRTLGALMADDERLDEVLHLGDHAAAQRRARAVANVLWPWGESGSGSSLYGPPLEPSTSVIRAHVKLGPPEFGVVPWDDARRVALHDALREHREVVLRAGHAERLHLRAALVDLQVHPVEVGPLLCHPVVVGQRATARYRECRLLLREAL